MQAVSVSFFKFADLRTKAWALSQMQWSRRPLRDIPEIGFVKQFGTGGGESFDPYPNFSVYAILATWPDLATARRAMRRARVFNAYQDHSVETWTVYLANISARGRWDGMTPFEPYEPERQPSPIAVLTRATIRASCLWRFWRAEPDISAMTCDQPGLLFKRGMGELPWIHQVTFSIWGDTSAMTQFAYRSGYHSRAVRQKREEDWFKEELFARFAILDAEGGWNGVDPLSTVRMPPPMPDAACETAASS